MSLNGYSYANGNPVNLADPSGLCAQPTQWWNPVDANCYYSAVGLAQRFSQGNPQTYNAWFDVLIQKDWGELKAIEALGTGANVTGSLNQFMSNSSILPSLFIKNPQLALQALQQWGCQNNINLGFLFPFVSGDGTAALSGGTVVGGAETSGVTIGGAPVVLTALGGLALGIIISLLFAGSAAEEQNNDITYYFRGTTEGFPGGATAQKLGVTSTSTQPGIATVFATVAETMYGGVGIVYIATSSDLSGVDIGASNWLNELEQEVVFEIAPLGFADLASKSVSAHRAREILDTMGRNIPSQITLQMQNLALTGLVPLTKREIEAFVQAVG